MATCADAVRQPARSKSSVRSAHGIWHLQRCTRPQPGRQAPQVVVAKVLGAQRVAQRERAACLRPLAKSLPFDPAPSAEHIAVASYLWQLAIVIQSVKSASLPGQQRLDPKLPSRARSRRRVSSTRVVRFINLHNIMNCHAPSSRIAFRVTAPRGGSPGSSPALPSDHGSHLGRFHIQ